MSGSVPVRAVLASVACLIAMTSLLTGCGDDEADEIARTWATPPDDLCEAIDAEALVRTAYPQMIITSTATHADSLGVAMSTCELDATSNRPTPKADVRRSLSVSFSARVYEDGDPAGQYQLAISDDSWPSEDADVDVTDAPIDGWWWEGTHHQGTWTQQHTAGSTTTGSYDGLDAVTDDNLLVEVYVTDQDFPHADLATNETTGQDLGQQVLQEIPDQIPKR